MVELFIREFKRAVRENRWQFIRRRKNLEFLGKLGWTEQMVVEYLAENLSPKHCYKGPEEERNSSFEPGVIFVFKMVVESFMVYIKIKKISREEFYAILSFHEDEGDLL